MGHENSPHAQCEADSYSVAAPRLRRQCFFNEDRSVAWWQPILRIVPGCAYDLSLVGDGRLDGQELQSVLQVPLDGRGRLRPYRVHWMCPTNQIAVVNSSGSIKVFYDPSLSKKGVLLSVGRAPSRKKATDFSNSVGEILTPHALPMFRQDTFNAKKKQNKAQSEALAPSRLKGAVKISENSTASEFTRYVVEGRKLENLRAEDPREALLKMEDKAKEGLFLESIQKHATAAHLCHENFRGRGGGAPRHQAATQLMDHIVYSVFKCRQYAQIFFTCRCAFHQYCRSFFALPQQTFPESYSGQSLRPLEASRQ